MPLYLFVVVLFCFFLQEMDYNPKQLPTEHEYTAESAEQIVLTLFLPPQNYEPARDTEKEDILMSKLADLLSSDNFAFHAPWFMLCIFLHEFEGLLRISSESRVVLNSWYVYSTTCWYWKPNLLV